MSLGAIALALGGAFFILLGFLSEGGARMACFSTAAISFTLMFQRGLHWRPWRWLAALLFAVGRIAVIGSRRSFGAIRRLRSGRRRAERPAPPALPESFTAALKAAHGPTVVALGRTKRRVVSIDLAKMQHTLAAGSTGAGKTNLLAGILFQLILKDRADVYVVDRKADPEDGLVLLRRFCAGYAVEIEEARSLLNDLVAMMESRNRGGQEARRRPILLLIDELFDVATDRVDGGCEAALLRLAQRGRSARIFIFAASQYPKSTELDTAIARNLMRKICLPTDTLRQAEVILGFQPPHVAKQPGEFWLKEQAGQPLIHGRAFRVRPQEVYAVIWNRLAAEADPRIKLLIRFWQTSAGVNKMAQAENLPVRYVENAYRNFAEAGALRRRGERKAYEWAVAELSEAVFMVKRYIASGQWADPKPQPPARRAA